MLYGVIYKITNIKNNKVYVGQTVYNINKRWSLHKRAASINDTAEGSKSVFHSAIRKYGHENFTVEVICSCFDKEELDLREYYFINNLNTKVPSGYNLKDGGANGKWTKESKRRLSNTLKAKHKTNTGFSTKISSNLSTWFNSLTEEEKHKHINFLSETSKNAWDIDRKQGHSADVKHKWNELSEEEKTKRKQTLYRNTKEYWSNNEKRLQQAELLKKAHKEGKYKNKKPSSLIRPIHVIEPSIGKTTKVSSIKEAMAYSKLSRSSVNKSLSKKITVNGFKFVYA